MSSAVTVTLNAQNDDAAAKIIDDEFQVVSETEILHVRVKASKTKLTSYFTQIVTLF